MKPEADPLSYLNEEKINAAISKPITRRDFLLGTARVLGGAALVYEADGILKKNANVPSKSEKTFSREIVNYPNAQFIWHNAACNPRVLAQALESTVNYIEIDVIPYKGQLIVADNLKDIEKMNKKDLEEQRVDRILWTVLEKEKIPEFDVKIPKNDRRSVSDLMALVSAYVPGNTPVRYSGNFDVVGKLEVPVNSIITPTVGSARMSEYAKNVKSWAKIDDGIKRGASVSMYMADNSDILAINNENGLNTNVWVVDNVITVLSFLKKGATGITSGSAQVIRLATDPKYNPGLHHAA